MSDAGSDRTAPLWITAAGQRLEVARHGPPPEQAPTLVLLHEGLGSVSLWRDFPQALAERTGCGVLVYSRQGYGRSDPVVLPRPLRYMHDEAEVLHVVLEAAGVRDVTVLRWAVEGNVLVAATGSNWARRWP